MRTIPGSGGRAPLCLLSGSATGLGKYILTGPVLEARLVEGQQLRLVPLLLERLQLLLLQLRLSHLGPSDPHRVLWPLARERPVQRLLQPVVVVQMVQVEELYNTTDKKRNGERKECEGRDRDKRPGIIQEFYERCVTSHTSVTVLTRAVHG